MNIDFRLMEETPSDFVDRLDLGVHSVMITGGVFDKSPNKETPYCEITFVSIDDSGDLTSKFYLSPKALPRLKELLVTLGVSDSLFETEISEEQLLSLITGKKLKILISGKEYVSQNSGEVKIARDLGFSNFCEPLTENSLKFNPLKHIKKLPTDVQQPFSLGISTTTGGDNTTSRADGLPF